VRTAPRRRRRSGGNNPPDLGWHDFYWAEDQPTGEINGTWSPRFGSGAVTASATGPVVRVGGSDFAGKKYVEHNSTAEHLYKAQASLANGFVIVCYGQVADTQGTGTWSLFDSYTDGTAPTDRCMAQFVDAALDQERINGGTQLQDNWGANTNDELWEIHFNGNSSGWLRDGVQTLGPGAGGSNAMAGLVIGGRFDLGAGGNPDNFNWAYAGRVTTANWAAGRARFLTWHNNTYAKAVA